MSCQFGSRERPGDAVRRIALEEIDAARAALVPAVEDAAALHDVRKRLKRLRALLDLARPALGTAAARAEDQALRDMGRQLARHRETDAIGALLLREARAAGSPDLDDLRAAVRLHHAADGLTRNRRRELEAVRRALLAFRRRVTAAPLGELRRRECRRRLRRSYRAARRRYRDVRRRATEGTIHAWRKDAKVLLNQTRLLAVWGDPALAEFRRILARLDDALGRARECAFLALILRGVPAAEKPLRFGLGLRAGLEGVAHDELVRALRFGARLFRRTPKAFVARMLD